MSEQAPEKRGPGRPPKPTQRYFRAVVGITDGSEHYTSPTVFVGSDALLSHYERTAGQDAGRTLYVEVGQDEYEAFEAARKDEIANGDNVPPPPPPLDERTPQVAPLGDQTIFPGLPPAGPEVIGSRPVKSTQ